MSTFKSITIDGTTYNVKDTGTTYNAGNVPNNTKYGTNGSIKKAYDNIVNTVTTPDYANGTSISEKSPTSTSPYTHKASINETVFLSAYRTVAGYNLEVYVNDFLVFAIPANTPGFCGLTIPLLKGQTLKVTTNTTSATWKFTGRIFKNVYLY